MLIITVHYPQRELAAKILLAYKASARFGYSIIGRSAPIRRRSGQVLRKRWKPFRSSDYRCEGTVVEVALTPEAGSGRLARFQRSGLNVVSFCEEATAYYDSLAYTRRRLDALDQVDLFFSWGEWHNRAIKLVDSPHDNVFESGHPRFEICQEKYRSLFSDQIDAIQRQYGRILLVNTNITEEAFADDGVDIVKRQMSKKLESTGRKSYAEIGFCPDYLAGFLSKLRNAFRKQVEIVRSIQKVRDDVTVVFRPKPSVSPAKLAKYADHLGFVGIVDGRFSVTPWLYSCQAVLHHGCTTGIEATLTGTPAIMLDDGSPVARPVIDSSFIVGSVGEAVSIFHDVFDEQLNPELVEQKRDTIMEWFANIDGSPVEAILNKLQAIGLANYVSTLPLSDLRLKPIPPTTTRNSANDYFNPSLPAVDSNILAEDVSFFVTELNRIHGREVSVYEIEPEVFLFSSNVVQ